MDRGAGEMKTAIKGLKAMSAELAREAPKWPSNTHFIWSARCSGDGKTAADDEDADGDEMSLQQQLQHEIQLRWPFDDDRHYEYRQTQLPFVQGNLKDFRRVIAKVKHTHIQDIPC